MVLLIGSVTAVITTVKETDADNPNLDIVYQVKNSSWEKSYILIDVQTPIVCFDPPDGNLTGEVYCTGGEWYKEKVFNGFVEVVKEKERIGIEYKDVYYENSHVVNSTLSTWEVPLEDRNFKEFGNCLDYENLKGVCVQQVVE